MNGPPAALAGLYGKLPAKADFVHRNLPSSFVRPWDEWLSRCLSASRAALAGRWTELYLSGPVWRFALEPGLLGPNGWGGVLATSVDAINRFFPLTIAVPVGGALTASTANARLDSWLPRLEDMALDIIEGAVDIETAVGEAQRIARALSQSDHRPPRYVWRDRDGAAQGWLTLSAGLPAPPVPPDWQNGNAGAASCWWRAPWNGEPAASLACPGLPPADIFVVFLDGRWFDHGWETVEPGTAAS